tara:strand:- start:1017 stop:1301 length:285 start_codon:yes stop_codon:yes gene_type:complete
MSIMTTTPLNASLSNDEYLGKLAQYRMSAQEAESGALVAAYLQVCLGTWEGANPGLVSPWLNRCPYEDTEAFTDTEFVRAALERANPWLTLGAA